jgi:hypothetical protein
VRLTKGVLPWPTDRALESFLGVRFWKESRTQSYRDIIAPDGYREAATFSVSVTGLMLPLAYLDILLLLLMASIARPLLRKRRIGFPMESKGHS